MQKARQRLAMFFHEPRSRWLVTAVVTALGSGWQWYRSATMVRSTPRTLPEEAFFLYMVTAFPILGMLIADLLSLLARHGLSPGTLELTLQLAALIIISSFRLEFKIPVSGHSMLFAFFLLRRAFPDRAGDDASAAELWLGGILFLMVAFIKLVIWDDPLSWVSGLATAAAVFLIARFGFRSIGRGRS